MEHERQRANVVTPVYAEIFIAIPAGAINIAVYIYVYLTPRYIWTIAGQTFTSVFRIGASPIHVSLNRTGKMAIVSGREGAFRHEKRNSLSLSTSATPLTRVTEAAVPYMLP